MLGFLLRTFPAVAVVGPRQCGKTTLARAALKGWSYLDLEDPGDYDRLLASPGEFFSVHPRRVLIDEAQRYPELFPLLRGVIDKKRVNGSFVLTGSAQPALIRQAGESLAGRLGLLELTPFGASELSSSPRALAGRWFWGGYPPVYALRGADQRTAWLGDYVKTFLERDIPALGIRMPPPRLRRLWMMLAHVHGGILNAADLARAMDLSQPTIGHYLDILEGAFMIRRLAPYFANISKRLVKSPKLYIRDSGLLHFLAGLRRPEELEAWPRRGQSWEGYVVEELIRRCALRWPQAGFYFWRTQAGAEVDLLIEHGRRLLAVEVKASAGLDARTLQGMRECMRDLGIGRGLVVYRGAERLRLAPGLEALPWSELERGGLPEF